MSGVKLDTWNFTPSGETFLGPPLFRFMGVTYDFRSRSRGVMRPTVSCFAILSYFLYLAPHGLYFLNIPSGRRYSIKIDSDVKYGNDRASGKWRSPAIT